MSLRPGRFTRLRRATQLAHLRKGVGLLGLVFETARPELTSDVAEFPPIRRDVMLRSGTRSMAAVPAMVRDQAVAALEFFADEPRAKDERIVECMANLGVQLGRVAERIRLEQQIAEITAYEQHRIGRELHDTVMQQLTGAAMMLRSLHQRLDATGSPQSSLAARIGDVVNDAQLKVR